MYGATDDVNYESASAHLKTCRNCLTAQQQIKDYYYSYNFHRANNNCMSNSKVDSYCKMSTLHGYLLPTQARIS